MNNTQETSKVAYQPGGTALVIINQLSHRVQGPSNIRWDWDDGAGLA